MESKRKHDRYYLSFYLKVIDRQTNLSVGHCVNISDGGMMVIRGEPIETKKIFQLKMFLPEEIEGSRYVNFIGVSKWCHNDENPDFYNAGFQLQNITPEVIQVIKHLIDNFCLNE
ncbi:MAG: PilZ domain-containing protein [Deltaproteobacteria bacterium]|nr:PilZ domain-containing protein [Deltaproteobacteria bacterium]